MDLLRLGDGRFHRFLRLKPEVRHQRGVRGPGHKDPGRVFEPLQGIGGHDPVDGVEPVAEAVLVEVFGPMGEVFFEEIPDFVRVRGSG